jgi:hypothetical protein
MIETNNRIFADGTIDKKKKISFYHSIIKDLGLQDKPSSLKVI